MEGFYHMILKETVGERQEAGEEDGLNSDPNPDSDPTP